MEVGLGVRVRDGVRVRVIGFDDGLTKTFSETKTKNKTF